MKIAVHAFDGITMFHLAAPLLVFGATADLGFGPDWETTVWTPTGGPVRTAEGVSLGDLTGPDAADDADLLVFPSWPHEHPALPDQLATIVRAAHGRGAQIAGLCLGAFPVAASGLLAGRSAVTHWAATDSFADLHPTVDVRPAALYIDHGDVLTSAGTVSAIDACLHIVRSRLGAAAATAVARFLVVAPQRGGDQAQFIEHPVPDHDDSGFIGDTLAWVLANLREDLSVEALATHACMSRRSFTRKFREVTGSTPARWVARRRLDAARTLLETTSWTVEHIAAECGFASTVTFRQNFVTAFATTPSHYRQRFGRVPAGDAHAV